HYIKKFLFQNTQGGDLWRSLDEVLEEGEGGSPKGPNGGVLKMWYIGSQWSKQMGFPLVTLEIVNSTTIKISQQRYKWDVPLFYQAGREKFGMKWLNRGRAARNLAELALFKG
ncbi:hypothetical protein ANCDUO_17139, partial [Ancylostoma duodenale]